MSRFVIAEILKLWKSMVMEDRDDFDMDARRLDEGRELKRIVEVEERRLILTSEQLLQIKKYVKKGRSLPTDRDAIEAALGGTIEHPKFHWTEIQILHRRIKEHAEQWLPIEGGLLAVGGHLGAFARNQRELGEALFGLISEMPISKRVAAYGATPLEDLPFIPFDELDQVVHAQLGELLDGLKESVNLSREPTVELKSLIVNFHEELSKKLVPLVEVKRNKLATLDFNVDLTQFRDELARVERDIAQSEKEINAHLIPQVLSLLDPVSTLLKFIFSGPEEALLGGAGSEVMYKLRTLENKRRDLIGMIDGREKLPHLILSHCQSLDSIQRLMTSAERASQALVVVWDSVLAEIDRSKKELELIKDGASLISFKLAFQRGIGPWEEVEKMAHLLLKSLNKAIEDFNKQQSLLHRENAV